MKKIFLAVPFILLFSFLFVSCEKELSIENGGVPTGLAIFTLSGGNADCTGALLNGSYKKGVALGTANTVVLQVEVDSVGVYTIITNTVNGIRFSATGIFSVTGLQTVTLTGTGTPTEAGVFGFSTGASSCSFDVTVEPDGGSSGGSAVYTFSGGTGSCTGAVVAGTYTQGTALGSTNTVSLQVDVSTAGTYTIASTAANGVVFNGSGSFTTTGIQNVVLTGSGTPGAAGDFNFTAGTSGCVFVVTFVPGPGGGGNFLRCKIDGVLKNFNTNMVGYYVTPPGSGIPFSISVQGKNSDISGSAEEFWVTITNPTEPTTGIYNNRLFSTGVTARACQITLYPTGFPNLYWGASTFDANTATVNITSVSTTGVSGIFMGTIYENNGLGPATKTVTEGEFQITF